MLARRLPTGIAPRTAFHIRVVLRTALNAAIPELIATNPAAKAEAPDVPDQEMLTLSTKEVGELIELSQDHRDGPLWSFLVGSVRLGEALGLRWSDYDEKTGQLQVKRQLRRTGRSSAGPSSSSRRRPAARTAAGPGRGGTAGGAPRSPWRSPCASQPSRPLATEFRMSRRISAPSPLTVCSAIRLIGPTLLRLTNRSRMPDLSS
jgi:integrase